MSPETYSTPESLEQRAHVIKQVLIRHESEVQQKTHDDRQARLTQIRDELNITTPPGDISDLTDRRIENPEVVYAPEFLAEALPLSEESADTTRKGRFNVENVLMGEDDRLLVIIGPCSIHDVRSALEYAEWVLEMREKYDDDLEIIMRVYPEKPRSVTGWKGLSYDPNLTEFLNPDKPEYDHSLGLVLTRMILNRITHIGVPAAMERLNSSTPQYTDALSTYDAIGARNSLDPNARAFLSGSSANGGLKHPPDGSLEEGLNGVEAASHPNTMLGTTMTGVDAQIKTKGNKTSHLILRGGHNVRNYTSEFVDRVKEIIKTKNKKSGRGLLEAIVIDASHANSEKDYTKQMEVVENVAAQISLGETAIKGVMIESHLMAGVQKRPESGKREDVKYDQSITDGCVDILESEKMLSILAQAVTVRRKSIAADNENS